MRSPSVKRVRFASKSKWNASFMLIFQAHILIGAAVLALVNQKLVHLRLLPLLMKIRPKLVQAPELHGLDDMRRADLLAPGKIGDRAGYAEDSIQGAGRERRHALRRFQRLERLGSRACH